MTITAENIAGLKKIQDELTAATEASTEAINAAKKFKDRKIKVRRTNGQVVEVKEAALWEEIRYIGAKSEGWDALAKKYPRAFELGEAQRKKADELKAYCHAEIGIDPMALRLTDIMNLIEAMIDYKVGKNNQR